MPAVADQQMYEVRTKDGVRYYGYLQIDTPERIVLRTPGGAVIELARAAVASVTVAAGTLVGQDYYPADPNPTRLFFGPTGHALKKGEGYFGTYELFMPTIQFGVTDRFSIGGGTPLYIGGGDHPFWFTPKFQLYEGRKASVSVGALHFLHVGDGSFGIAYAAGTFGSRNDAVTVGAGWAYEVYGEDNTGTAMLMVGAERRVSRRIKFITENYFIGGDAVISGGGRFLGESLSADIGLFTPLGVGEAFAFPIVNFVWKF
ncbi:MAG: hypothetical protein EXQ49_02000 [Acidobacteria bacterium]|nr:hypothetical protein [Acidobacteriota bacterium]